MTKVHNLLILPNQRFFDGEKIAAILEINKLGTYETFLKFHAIFLTFVCKKNVAILENDMLGIWGTF